MSEQLAFKITLSGTYHKKVPLYSIYINDKLIVENSITVESDQPEIIEFVTDELNEGDHELKIRLDNKEPSDTIKDPNSEELVILNDMLLNIHDIEIDQVSLSHIIRSAEYFLDEPQSFNDEEITKLTNCVNLGWNGSYVLKFSSPFYMWLLENL